MNKLTVKCPNCGEEIALENVLREQLEDRIREELGEHFKKKSEDEKKEWLKEETLRIKEEMEKAKEKTDEENEYLKKSLEEKTKKLEDFREEEMRLRIEKEKLEEAKKDQEVLFLRKMEEERVKLLEKVEGDFRMKEMEKDKVIEKMKQSIDEMKRQSEVGSQQLQGEVLELDLEETLRTNFTFDSIEPVAKGRKGADVKQIVRTSLGNTCGMIVWEIKRTKSWQNDWTEKLRDDMRAEKANVAVIVTTTLPKDMKVPMGIVDGVWVCSPSLMLPLAELLRGRLIDVAKERFVGEKRGEKTEVLYSYMTSHEFAQHIGSLAEVYMAMQEQVVRERVAFEKIWKTREQQIKRLFTATGGMVGELRGILGQSMPQIKEVETLELGE